MGAGQHGVAISVRIERVFHDVVRPGADDVHEQRTGERPEREALAQTHGLLSVDSFLAELDLKRWRKDGVRIRGTVKARIVQECIVTLEPVPSELDVAVDAVFLPEGSRLARPLDDDGAMIVDPDGPDLPETFEGGASR